MGNLWFYAIPKHHALNGIHCTLTKHPRVSVQDANLFLDVMSAQVLRHRKVVARRRESLDVRLLADQVMLGVHDNKPAQLCEFRNLGPLVLAAQRILPVQRFGGSRCAPVPHISMVPGARQDYGVWRDVDLVVSYRGEYVLLPRLPNNW